MDWHTEGDFTIQSAEGISEIQGEAERSNGDDHEATIDLNAVFVEVQRLAAYDDFYLHHEIPGRVLRNAEDRFLPKRERERLMAFLDNTAGCSGCDGVAFTASGIYWRNNHNEEPNALLWQELASVPVKFSERNNEVRIGAYYIDLSHSTVKAAHLAKILRGIKAIVEDSHP